SAALGERLLLRGARSAARLDQMQAERVVERGVALPGRAEDVGREPSAARARLDEIEESHRRARREKSLLCVLRDLRGCFQQPRHLLELDLEELAEERPDVDAGKKI